MNLCPRDGCPSDTVPPVQRRRPMAGAGLHSIVGATNRYIRNKFRHANYTVSSVPRCGVPSRRRHRPRAGSYSQLKPASRLRALLDGGVQVPGWASKKRVAVQVRRSWWKRMPKARYQRYFRFVRDLKLGLMAQRARVARRVV